VREEHRGARLEETSEKLWSNKDPAEDRNDMKRKTNRGQQNLGMAQKGRTDCDSDMQNQNRRGGKTNCIYEMQKPFFY
jgi:hypothetical protein